MMTSTFANYELGLSFFFACCAKATILLACAWLSVIALRWRSSAAQRHYIWAAAILASLALPFFAMLLPAWHSATLGGAAALWSPAHANSAEFDPSHNSFEHHQRHSRPSTVQQTCRDRASCLGDWVLIRSAKACNRSCASRVGLRVCEAPVRRGLDLQRLATLEVPQNRRSSPSSGMRELQRDASHLGNFSPRHRAAHQRRAVVRRAPLHGAFSRTRSHFPS